MKPGPGRSGWYRMAVAVVACLLAGLGCLAVGRAADEQGDRSLRMVDEQLRIRGIRDARVLDAMARVPRHRFVPPDQQDAAYGDHPLPIGFGQTISQPYIVAFMTEALDVRPTDTVLEIGTGSGYQAAILGELAKEVYSVEIVAELGERAKETLSALGYRNVQVRIGDGYRGWPEHAPFSRIILTAAPEEIPQALVEQLAVGGRMVLPVGPVGGDQELRILTRTPDGVTIQTSLPVRFVPMVKPPGH
jgi:protein-L-isoaspartate(D-aspartate) O-methyltransferase